jgi:hypothetical protein
MIEILNVNFFDAPLEIGGTLWCDVFGLRSVKWNATGIQEAKTRGPLTNRMIEIFLNWQKDL